MPNPKRPAPKQPPPRAKDAEVGELFAMPPEQFVKRRDELVAKLKARGAGKAASLVKALDKPTLAAWVVNQLARESPAQIAELLEAASRLRKVQAGALKRQVSAEELRSAAHAEREALGALIRRAGDVLRAANRSESSGLLGRIESTLHAHAVGTTQQRELLRGGRLTHESVAAGFGGLLEREPQASAPAARRSPRPAAEDLRQVRAALREAEREVNRLRTVARTARKRAQRLQGRADRLSAQAGQAQSEAAAASRHAAEAERRLEAGIEAAGRAQSRLSARRAS